MLPLCRSLPQGVRRRARSPWDRSSCLSIVASPRPMNRQVCRNLEKHSALSSSAIGACRWPRNENVSQMAGIRERAHAEVIHEIKRLARDQLAVTGAPGLSLRAIS